MIELLVVIAILSLLVSILLPSLQKAKLLARRVLCLTRLKAIGSVYYLYLNDNDGVGPKGFSYSDPSWFHWRSLGGYLGVGNNAPQKDKMAVTCPNWEDYILGASTTGTTYAVNAYLGYEKYLGEEVDAPASTPMIMDGLAHENGDPNLGIRWYPLALPNDWGFVLGGLWFMDQATISHEGTGNFLFFDGHAENQEELDTLLMYRLDLGWTWYGNNQQL